MHTKYNTSDSFFSFASKLLFGCGIQEFLVNKLYTWMDENGFNLSTRRSQNNLDAKQWARHSIEIYEWK